MSAASLIGRDGKKAGGRMRGRETERESKKDRQRMRGVGSIQKLT